MSFEKMLKKYALSVLTKDFGLLEQAHNLNDIAKTRLILREEELILTDGYGQERNLGKNCRTDWIGKWDHSKAHFGNAPVAGDSTDTADVSGWATDYFQIDIEKNRGPIPVIALYHEDGHGSLGFQAVLMTRAGSMIVKDAGDIAAGRESKIDLEAVIKKEGIGTHDIEAVYLLITNLHPQEPSIYQLKTG